MTPASNDELLASLLEELLAAGSSEAAVEAVLARHPALARDIRELWATARLAAEVGSLPQLLPMNGAEPTLPAAAPLQSPGDYELLAELGRGGMGVVYKARQKSLGRLVALKMIRRADLASPQELARFRAEAQSAARLSHPHIVPVYEVGEYEGQPFFSMKYIDGVTLAQRLAAGPLPAREAAELLLPVARAVAEAHRHGVLHRDLKASNILIDRDGRPYVSDFGLAKRVTPSEPGGEVEPTHIAALTHSGAILGTPAYMSPEQAAGNRGELTPASDVYSLGAILYAMLTGRPPFQAASPLDTILMVLEQDPVPPRVLNPRADRDLEMIALKCLQKPPDLRYRSADALADDLAAYLGNEPISARSSQLSQVLTRALRETHHAGVLESWGLLWMWHSLVLLLLCLVTNAMQCRGVESRWPYLGLWVVGLGVWAGLFWQLRHRSGPVTFVERQIAHVWAGSMIASTLLYGVEWLLGLRVLELSPVLALTSGMVFLIKAGILSGRFYLQAAALFATGIAMAAIRTSGLPDLGLSLFGVVSAASFFFPGWKYYRQRVQGQS